MLLCLIFLFTLYSLIKILVMIVSGMKNYLFIVHALHAGILINNMIEHFIMFMDHIPASLKLEYESNSIQKLLYSLLCFKCTCIIHVNNYLKF